MGITINEPIILTEAQLKRFDSVVIFRNPAGLMQARVMFSVLCPVSQKVLKEEVIEYSGEEYNEFWSNFNNGKFLYEELVKNEEDIEVPDEVEDDFINQL